jgi:hypothetical protein
MTEDIKRACSNCQAWGAEEQECWNGLSEIGPDGCCHLHRTVKEDQAETGAINRYRAQLGLPPLKIAE